MNTPRTHSLRSRFRGDPDMDTPRNHSLRSHFRGDPA